MTHQRWMWIFLLIILSAAATADAKSKTTAANLACIEIKPSVVNGRLTRDTVIETTLQYSIDLHKLKKDKYTITMLFGSSEGQNVLFNKKKTRLGDADLILKATSGSVKLKYPMDAIWNDPRLKRPVSIFFYIIEHNKNGSSQAIASAGPFVFRSLF